MNFDIIKKITCENYFKKHDELCFAIVVRGDDSFTIMSDHRTPNFLRDFIDNGDDWWRTLDELKISIDEISDIKEQHEKEARAFFEGLKQ